MKDVLKLAVFCISSFYGLYLLCSAFNCLYMLDWSYKTILAGVGIGFAIAMAIRELVERHDDED